MSLDVVSREIQPVYAESENLPHSEVIGYSPEPGYQTLSFARAYNWERILPQVREKYRLPLSHDIIGVHFDSVIKPDADIDKLDELDELVLEEAKKIKSTGPFRLLGYLDYIKGVPDDDGNYRSSCLWVDRESAAASLKGEAHQQAIALAREVYSQFRLGRYILRSFPDTPKVEVIATE
ncbi:MAG: hypothetical protein M3Q14_01060 [bacterium]|nr:hypothetical protein [bacterium]